MFLSKRKNGIYYIYYENEFGKRVAVTTKTKLKSAAQKYLAEFSRKIEEKRNQKTTPISLYQFMFEFLKHSEAVHTYWTNYTYKQTFRFIKKFFSDIPLTLLSGKMIGVYIEHRINTASAYQARKDLINISAAMNWAVSQGFLLENPCKGVKKVKVPQKLPLFYTEQDFNKLLSVIDSKDIRDIVTFAVYTGMRQMELLKLQWNQINMKDKIVILNNQHHITKGKRVRTIPLNEKALEVLRHRDTESIQVFTFEGKPMTQDFLSHKFAGYVVLAEIDLKLNFHSLRHTFASWLVQAGVSIYEVSKLLGHAEIKTTQIYAHLRSEDLRNAVNLL